MEKCETHLCRTKNESEPLTHLLGHGTVQAAIASNGKIHATLEKKL